MGSFFGINGRFLNQSPTGVQRYAYNVLEEINKSLHARNGLTRILVPHKTKDLNLTHIPMELIGRSAGHFWEQIELPKHCDYNLLNLCNTAPITKNNQVVCIHDANVFIYPESYNLKFRTFYRLIQPRLARRAAVITTVSKFSASQISEKLGLKISDICVLPNGHEHVFKWKSEKAILAPLALSNMFSIKQRPFVMALGSNARHKNLSMLISIAPDLDRIGVDLLIVGGDVNIFASQSQTEINNVQYIRHATDHDLAYLFERALCLAFPSLTEGFGLPALEAMALGCPVVSTNRASLPEICGEAALMANPEQPAQWVKKISTILESKDLRDELKIKGLAQASTFSWTETADGYIEIMTSNMSFRGKESLSKNSLPKIAVIIASTGRPKVLAETLRRIVSHQTYKPDSVVISCVSTKDVDNIYSFPSVRLVTGPAGLANQRNKALETISDSIDVVVFFDDDFVPESNWLAKIAKVFQEERDIIGLTGNVILDGIKGPGLSFDQVDLALLNMDLSIPTRLIEPFSPYGCNMAFRRKVIKELRFDSRLVLYGWLEDRDFGAALAKNGGRMVKCMEARGVHMGVKSGRVSGKRLGYSQIVNPIYLLKKGTMTYTQVIDHIFRNLASNILFSIKPEPFIDRRGRLVGNFRGMLDVLRGRIEPERAEKGFGLKK